ncbi:hypothetical protein [uncultured Psychromonas sp.]|uniref:hypothetical protein n=1 Tax=uncultured Psychromonas sp. TaxID=173974 RepID=UPI002630713A|nr:hypothetical protein [uncultured Psychromonas sp.]
MKNKLIAILLPLTLTACSNTQTSAPVQFTNISIPELNTQTTAYLGDNLLKQAMGYYAESIELGFMDAYAADIQGGTFYKVPSSGQMYKSDNANTVNINNGFGTVLSQQNWVKYDEDNNEICVSYANCYEPPQISITKNDEPTFIIKPNTFQQIIEYNGKTGDILRFTYREFSDNSIRQAYSTDFTMDLNDGDTIGYKGAVIKVHKANNSVIEYSVIRNFIKS